MSHDLLLGPSQVEVTFIHIQIPIFGKIFQQRVSPHALLTKAFTYSFEGRVALWSRVASMCSLVSDGDFVGQNVPREMFTHNKQLNWNVFFNAHLGCIFFHHAFTQLHFSKKQKNSKYPSAIYYMRGFFIRTQKTNRSNFVMEASWIVQEKGTSTCREWCWQISTALLLWYTISLQLGDEGFNLQRFCWKDWWASQWRVIPLYLSVVFERKVSGMKICKCWWKEILKTSWEIWNTSKQI